jgi:predicted O-methyltransferase YrrM
MNYRASANTLASELFDDELACLLQYARTSNRGARFLEIGTAAGGTLCRMMGGFSDAERPRFVVVDPMNYFPNQVEIVKRNLSQHGLPPEAPELRISTSAAAFPLAEAAREEYDFMLIDGSHKIRYVTEDLRWTRLLRAGGIVCMHDYGPIHKGVTLPADRLLSKHPNYRRECLTRSLLVLRKESASTVPEISPGDLIWANLLSPLLQLELSISKRLRKLRQS